MRKASRLYFFFFFLCYAHWLLAEDAAPTTLPEPISLVNLTSEPSSFVNGSVNVISGDYIKSGSDYVVSGSDPFVIGHMYSSGSLEKGSMSYGWSFQHSDKLLVFQPYGINYTKDLDSTTVEKPFFEKGHSNPTDKKSKYTHLYLIEPSGGHVLFKGDGWAENFKPVLKNTGWTNAAFAEISGKNSLKNFRISWDSSSDEWRVRSGDGTLRIYGRKRHKYSNQKPGKYNYHFRDYQIKEEQKPSGAIT